VIRVTGGQVLTEDGLVEADVWVEGDRVAAVGSHPAAGEHRVIDAGGMLVGPGFVDIHTHLREPGQTWKEDIASGSHAAAAGGYTAVVAMPNTDPPIDTPALVRKVQKAGDETGLVLVEVAGALTVGRLGRRPCDIDGLYRSGVRLFSDDGDSVADDEVLGEAMSAVAGLPGAVVAQHAEDRAMSAGGHMHQGIVSEQLGIAGIPARAEFLIVERDLALVAATGAAYHAQHVSSARTVELIREAKVTGLKVTAEVTPHHLTFDESALLTLDTDLKMYPPLRSADDRQSLRDGLRDGTIDAVATDHAPHTPADKGVGFDLAPRGVIGLETAAPAVWEAVAAPGRFFEVMSTTPARIAGLARHGRPIEPGSPANLVVFDAGQTWVPERFLSKSSNSPYKGREMTGRVMLTIYEGMVTHLLEAVR
jgi:dihydroorotase